MSEGDTVSSERLERSAIHEAAHVIVAAELGVEVHQIVVSQREAYMDHEKVAPALDARIGLAGFLGAARYAAEGGLPTPHKGSAEVERAYELLRAAGLDPCVVTAEVEGLVESLAGDRALGPGSPGAQPRGRAQRSARLRGSEPGETTRTDHAEAWPGLSIVASDWVRIVGSKRSSAPRKSCRTRDDEEALLLGGEEACE